MRTTARTITILILLIGLAAPAAADWRKDVRELLTARQYTKALAELAKQGAEAESADGLVLRAEAEFELGAVADAAADLRKSLEANEASADAHAWLSLCLAKNRDLSAANKEAQRAVEIAREPLSLYALAVVDLGAGKLDEAGKLLDEAIDAGNPRPEFLIARGAMLRVQDNLGPAELDFARAEKIDPRPYKVHLERASTFVVKGDPIGAKEEVAKVLKIAPEMYHGYLARGFIAQEFGEPEAALVDFTKAIELAPQVVELHFAKANLEVGLGRHDEAEKTLLRCRKQCERIADWYVMLALVQGALNKNDEALITLNELIGITPSAWQGYNLRGQLYGSQKKFDEALADFDKAIEIAPKAVEPRLNKATIQLAKKDTEGALALVEAVLADYPKNVVALEMRMNLHQALGDSAAALSDLEQIDAIRKEQSE